MYNFVNLAKNPPGHFLVFRSNPKDFFYPHNIILTVSL